MKNSSTTSLYSPFISAVSWK